MTFNDYDKLCVMAQQAKPSARLFVASYDPMSITFHWRWNCASDELTRGFSYCFHVGELEAAGLTISDDCTTDFAFAKCSEEMGRY